jgi:hypothetical protein
VVANGPDFFERTLTMNMATFRRFVPSFVLGCFVLAASVHGFAQYVLTCSSDDWGRHYCAADTRAGVSLQRQRSGSPCTQGKTWGFDQQGVWVDRGCRADFLVNANQSEVDRTRGRDHDGGDKDDHDRDKDRDRNLEQDRDRERYVDQDRDRDRNQDNHDGDAGRDDRRAPESMQLSCSSDDWGRHYCESDIQGKATMVRQRSGSPCREGYSWGYDRRGIWVDHGCRADFQLTGRRSESAGAGYNPGYVGTLNCSSNDGNRQNCQTDTRGGVRITRQISESACRIGYSWGYDRDGVWVDHGCRAEFQIGNGR